MRLYPQLGKKKRDAHDHTDDKLGDSSYASTHPRCTDLNAKEKLTGIGY